MKLLVMKKDALDTFKENLPSLYGKYHSESTNKWMSEIYGGDPFIEFRDVPEFALADLDSNMTPGEIDLNNCKIIYEKLKFLSESQASDERLWAGLCNGTFYEYMRKRWEYGNKGTLLSAEKETGAIKTRFFYSGSGRSGFYRNTLAKCWWVGHNVYDINNSSNPFESLDVIGSNDINSKINELFRNFTFSSNPNVMAGIVDAIRKFNDDNEKLLVKEHIRPAMSYLNAIGGSVVIDYLARDQISSIFTDAITVIKRGDNPSLDLNNSIDDNQDEDYSEDIFPEEVKTDVRVVLGCKVIIKNKNAETKQFKVDYFNGNLNENLKSFIGHKLGDSVDYQGENWTIEDISFS